MAQLTYKFKSDILFKMIFVKYADLRLSLVAAALGVAPKSISKIVVLNPEITPEIAGGKFCRLDLNMIVDGEQVDLEMQIGDEGNFRERSTYYLSKLFASALPQSGNYKDIPKTILVSIVGFPLFKCKDIFSQFTLLEQTRHELLTDKVELRFFELSKLPKEIDTNDMMQVWLKVFSTETEEDIKDLEKLEVSEVAQVIKAYKGITATDAYRELERTREKARNDEANALSVAEKRGELRGIKTGEKRGEKRRSLEIAKNALAMGMTEEQARSLTGLTRKEIETLSR